MRPLKLSQKPFCMGFPGAMRCQAISCSCCHVNMAFDVNSVPLSDTINLGLPRRAINSVSSRATRHAPARNRGVRNRRQTFARHVIDNVQHAEPSAIGELIVDEI